MAILKLKPACKDYLWGGRRLIEEFSFGDGQKICAEAWVLSAHEDGESTVIGGEFAGKTLAEYFKLTGTETLGTNCRRFENLPVLIKFIDAKENLSVQVHPPDDYAKLHENQLGKMEMWYILDAEENSFLYCGFKKKISRDEFSARIKNNSLIDVLNAMSVKKGDVIFIPAGTVHAIGKGILLVEIQQNSNVSYRICDYGRGRPLHIEKALDVTDLKPAEQSRADYPHLVACEYFIVDKLNLDGEILSETCGKVDGKTFLSVLILDGQGEISCGRESFSYRKGDSFFIAANSGDWKICGSCDALLTTIP